jgi:hypothetical protein
MVSLSHSTELVIRSVVLGTIVFSATTAIPAQEITTANRVIISIIVVILYNLMDYFSGFLRKIRKFLCMILCGCEPGGSSSSNSISTLIPPNIDSSYIKGGFNSEELASEVDAALRTFDSGIDTPAVADPIMPPIIPGPGAATEEDGALKASGLLEEEETAPTPAETAEGFTSYGFV